MITPTSDLTTRTGRGRRRGTIVALLATAALMASPVSAASSTPYGTNLVRNPGAQDGSSSRSGNGVVSIPRWDTFANMTVVKYGTSGFPSKSRGNAIDGGSKFFSAGRYSTVYGTCGDAQQTIHLRGRGSLIDDGRIRVHLSGRVAAAGDAVAHFDLYFRDSRNHSVASNGISRSVHGSGSSFRLVSASKTVSARTRILRVHLWADGVESGYCKAYFDNIKVTISRAH
ncbi:MAG: hypothetical protein R3C32_11675 [Chloroflexota bacterium]